MLLPEMGGKLNAVKDIGQYLVVVSDLLDGFIPCEKQKIVLTMSLERERLKNVSLI